MANILEVLSVSGRSTIQDNANANHDERYLTLGDMNPASGNRYYVSLSGEDADVEWHEGDRVMVELSLLAYKTQGRWHMSHYSDSIKIIEINSNTL